jgi:hypothetical protein
VEATLEKVIYDRIDRLAGSLGIPVAEALRRIIVNGLPFVERDARIARIVGQR